jgi:hypothetical protein
MPNSITQMPNLLGRDREPMPNLLGIQAQAGTTITLLPPTGKARPRAFDN